MGQCMSTRHFTALSVKKDTYICSLHFKGGRGPTEEYPDLIPATATKYEANIVSDGQKGPNIQDQHSMLKNSCDEETQTSSCCLTLNESLALKLENFQLKSKISEIEKNVYSQKCCLLMT